MGEERERKRFLAKVSNTLNTSNLYLRLRVYEFKRDFQPFKRDSVQLERERDEDDRIKNFER